MGNPGLQREWRGLTGNGQRRGSAAAIVVICLLLSIPAAAEHATPFTGSCLNEGTFLIVEAEGRAALVDLSTLSGMDIPLDPDLIRHSISVQRLLNGLGEKAWHVDRIANERGLRIQIVDTRRQTVVVDQLFPGRIELAATAVSPSRRFTVHVQANNVASEVTILDAHTAATQRVTISHSADLAAYAIGIVFSPGERCAAVSMERAGGDGAETWVVDLESGSVTPVAVPDIFALAWA